MNETIVFVSDYDDVQDYLNLDIKIYIYIEYFVLIKF